MMLKESVKIKHVRYDRVFGVAQCAEMVIVLIYILVFICVTNINIV